MLVEYPRSIIYRMHYDGFNTHLVCQISNVPHGIIKKPFAKAIVLSRYIDGQTAQKDDGNEVGHILAQAMAYKDVTD